MTHFGLGSSGEDPWGKPIRGVRCKIAFLGTSTVCLRGSPVLLRSLEGPLPGWTPGAFPAWPRTLTACLTCGEAVACLGRAFPSRGVGGGLTACLEWSAITREGGELPELLLSCFLPQREGEHLPGRLEKLLDCLLPWGKRKLPTCLPEWPELLLSCFLPQGEGEHLPGRPRKPDCLPEMLLNCFLSKGEGEHLPAWVAWEAWLPAWDATKLLPSLGGRFVPACLPASEAKYGEELTLVIFPSFLFSKLLNLFSCLCLTIVNLISPTFSMKPWHSLSLYADRIDANCDVHSSVCLVMLSRILFIALTLAWSKSFSAFSNYLLSLFCF